MSEEVTVQGAPTPAALEALAPSSRLVPFACVPAHPEAVSLGHLLGSAIAAATRAGLSLPTLAQHGEAIAQVADRLVSGVEGAVPIGDVFDRVLPRLPAALDLSTVAAAALDLELAILRPRLPVSGTVIGFGPDTLRDLVHTVVRQAREASHELLLGRVRGIVSEIEARLDAERLRGRSRTAAELAATLGQVGVETLDASALARNLPEPRGTLPLDPARRERLAATLSTLRAFLDERGAGPEVVLVSREAAAEALDLAAERFEEAASRTLPALRAMRAARLDLAGQYEPTRHDALLERLDWRGLGEDEISALPAVVVIEDARVVRRRALSTLSTILLSGRPILVAVAEDPADPDLGPDAHAGYHPGLGYLAVAHRETCVLQSSLGRPRHLIDGLRTLATSAGPSAAFVAVPRWDVAIPPGLRLAAYWTGRGTPSFLYDPRRGSTWADRFDLSDNPEIDRAWPVVSVGSEREAFTWAHAAALDPAWAGHFRPVAQEQWTEDQVEVAGFLAADRDLGRRLVPFVWTIDGAGARGRAVISRALAFACADRVRAWHILQELAGTDNEYVSRAVRRAREEAAAESARERERIEAEHAAAIERIRAESAGDAMRRLAGTLLGLEATPEPAAPEPSAAAPAAPETAAVEAQATEDPWIDSALCTSCNECTNLNGKMFRYNQDKQAYLADASAGTFAQLVRAAEKCPARCIHPGRPRPGDKTATPALVARAEAFA